MSSGTSSAPGLEPTLTTAPRSDRPAPRDRRTRLAQVLMWIASAGALAAAVGAIIDLPSAGADTLVVETWRAYGLVLFAGLFALLALRPDRYRGVWGLVLLHKLALTVTAAGYAAVGGIADVGAILVWDGILAVLIIVAYVAGRGWAAEPRWR